MALRGLERRGLGAGMTLRETLARQEAAEALLSRAFSAHGTKMGAVRLPPAEGRGNGLVIETWEEDTDGTWKKVEAIGPVKALVRLGKEALAQALFAIAEKLQGG